MHIYQHPTELYDGKCYSRIFSIFVNNINDHRNTMYGLFYRKLYCAYTHGTVQRPATYIIVYTRLPLIAYTFCWENNTLSVFVIDLFPLNYYVWIETVWHLVKHIDGWAIPSPLPKCHILFWNAVAWSPKRCSNFITTEKNS